MRRLALALLLASLTSCNLPGQTAPGDVRYTLGAPYQTGGVWRYPQADFSYDDTGIATVATRGGGRTADGEAFDQSALAAGHRTLQLPAIARITNLENGRSVEVRINDRGPADPARLIAVTRRTALLLAAANPAAFRVRVQVLTDQSRQLAASLNGDSAPPLKVATAPAGGVQSEALAPLPGVANIRGRNAPAAMHVASSTGAALAPVPLRMPEIIHQNMARPGSLAVDFGDFGELGAARLMAARFGQFGARVTTSYDAPRDRAFMVRVFPFATLRDAEALLQRALRSGAPDARIVVQ